MIELQMRAIERAESEETKEYVAVQRFNVLRFNVSGLSDLEPLNF